MLRRALPLSIALLVIVGAGASDGATVMTVPGDVRALAFSGDALVVVRVPSRGRLVLERRAAGSPAQTIFGTSSTDDHDAVSLAASADALALGLTPDSDDDESAPGRVMVGPARGPLREVARCPRGLTVSPVAVVGSRIAWREGACGEPASAPNSVSPAAIVVGGADPAAPVSRTAIGPERLPVAVVLAAGDAGLVGTLLPSFFGFDTEVRAFSPAGLGATVATGRARLVSPVGILANGTGVFLEAGLDDEGGACDSRQLFTIAPGASDRRPVPVGGCLIAAPMFGARGPQSPVATGDRITAFVGTPRSRPSPTGGPVAIVSVRGDGSDRRVIVKGGYRQPQGVAAVGGQVAWWQPRCGGSQEIVVQSSPEPSATLAACRAEILTRSARLRGGRIAVRVRCPIGCTGSMFGGRLGRPFTFDAGTHSVSLRVAIGRRRSRRVRVGVEIANGPSRSVLISVRR